METHQVVIVGTGFAGLQVAKGLKNSKQDVIVIDKMNHHVFQPLLYQVATAALSPADIALPIRRILKDQKNTMCIMGEVVDIDTDTQEVILKNGDCYNYDTLVIAIGARHSYFGHDEWEQYAPGLKSIRDAIDIRQRILLSFEKAERCFNWEKAKAFLTFVIVGAGPTGVEMAGAIAEIARQTMLKHFRRIDPTKTIIYLVEGAPRVLPQFPEALSKKTQVYLESLGVTVLTNKIVKTIDKKGVTIGDDKIISQNVIWAAGNEVSPLLKKLKCPLDKQGRIKIESDLSIPNNPNVFVLGDAACLLNKKGVPYPAIASVATQQGRHVAKIIKNNTPKSKRKDFVYVDKGLMATIGRSKAVGLIGNWKISGLFAWFLWSVVHIYYLIGFQNRLRVFIQWMVSFFSGRRSVCLIHTPFKQDIIGKNQSK